MGSLRVAIDTPAAMPVGISTSRDVVGWVEFGSAVIAGVVGVVAVHRRRAGLPALGREQANALRDEIQRLQARLERLRDGLRKLAEEG